MCSSVAECTLNRGESVVQSLALRKKTYACVCSGKISRVNRGSGSKGACCIHLPCDSASQTHIKEKRSGPQSWPQTSIHLIPVNIPVPGFPTEYKFLHIYTFNIYSIRWQCCPSCHPSLNPTCCLCQLQLLPRSHTVMTLHLGLGRPNLWQQPGEQSLPSNCVASSHPCSLWLFCCQLSLFPAHLYNTFLVYESLAAYFPAIFLYHLYFPQSPCSKTNPRNISLLLGQVFLHFSYRIPKATHPQVLIIYCKLPLIQSRHQNGTRTWETDGPTPHTVQSPSRQ